MPAGPLSSKAAGQEPLCPSVQCSTDARLIGVVAQDGTVGYLKPSLPVSQSFVDTVAKHGRPTTRFRFTAPCIQKGCQNWREDSCRIIEKEVEARDPATSASSALPPCSIRSRCVWFGQRRAAACRICPHIITDTYTGENFAGVNQPCEGHGPAS